MRTKKTFLNMTIGVITLFISTIASFVLRTIFIKKLGETYLGINGLLTNILLMLSMAELGIGSAIGFSLYKPLSENNTKKIKILMKYYKKAYYIIGIIVFVLGLILMPFLPFFVKNEDMISNFYLIYFIYLVATSYTYFFSYKRTLIASDQKTYKLSLYDTFFRLLTVCLQIVYLLISNNFIVYLLIQFFVTLVQNIVVNIVINKEYPYLKEKVRGELSKDEKNSIVKNIKGLCFYKVGAYLVGGTDNIIMSKYISIASVAIYSNYTLIINTVSSFLTTIFGSATASFGNLISVESKNKVYDVFKTYNFIGFWIYGFSSVAFLFLLNPFIKLWIGDSFLLDTSIVIIIVINFYLSSMLSIIDNVKSSAGVYHQDRFVPLFQALVNLVVSVILTKTIGLVGVFIGTLASTIFVILWAKPYFLYKYVFNKSMWSYFITFIKYLLVLILDIFLVYYVFKFTDIFIINKYLNFVIKMVIVTIVPNLINLILFHKTYEYLETVDKIKMIIKKKCGN